MTKSAKKVQVPEPLQQELEIAVSQQSGYAGAGDVLRNSAKHAFEALGGLLSDAVAPLREQLSGSQGAADEIEISLSLMCQAGGKWVIAEASGQTTVAIKLVWKKAAATGTVVTPAAGEGHV